MSPFTADMILSLFPEGARKQRRVRELVGRLMAFGDAVSLKARVDALEGLGQFIMRPDAALPTPDPPEPKLRRELHRVGVLVTILERSPDVAAAVRASIFALLSESSGVGLLAETGLPNDRGLMNESIDRLFTRILPAPRDDHELSRLLLRLFPTADEMTWLRGLTPALFSRLATALSAGDDESPFGSLQNAAAEAFALLGARVQALGLSEQIRARATPGPVRESPFFLLPRAGDVFLSRLSAPEPRATADRVFRDTAARCQGETAAVLEHLEQKGISIDVVYALEVIDRAMQRLSYLQDVLGTDPGEQRLEATRRLLVVLVQARLDERSLRELGRANLKLLARKIIERAGQTGEHYIAHTRREYGALLRGALGGGLLTTLTAAMKVKISAAHLPPFVEGFASGINYSLSFILMQLLGFTLATKQPSMTAAHLAGVIGKTAGPTRTDELVAYTARICRTQLGAAMGNVSAVALGAALLDGYFRFRSGGSFLTIEKSQSVLTSLNPIASGTIWFAMLTGVILWLSSVAAGSIENFFVFHRVPEGIAEHRAARFVGERTMGVLSRFFARNISGIGGSIALGMMLGMTPPLGMFFGLPLDVRHVTLSSGTLVLAAAAQGVAGLTQAPFLWACLGIAVIFVLNLTTSFTLALGIALRARDVPAGDKWRLGAAVVLRALSRPWQFILPPGKHEHAPAGGGH